MQGAAENIPVDEIKRGLYLMFQDKIEIETQGIIQSQGIVLAKEVSLIYGYNNCGKTTLLKSINSYFDKRLQRSILDEKESSLSLYLPTNRLVVNQYFAQEYCIPDKEVLLNYKRDIYNDFASHLNVLRKNLFKNGFIQRFVLDAVNNMFDTEIKEYDQRYSDGIENVINIYLNIIWILTWETDYQNAEYARIQKYISERQVYILIDEMEMFLHVKIQDRFIECIKRDFPNCIFVFTTHSPLLLTRYKNIAIYELKDGLLEFIDTDYYFADLDYIYESLFKVKELPDEAAKRINYLSDIILGIEDVEQGRVRECMDFLEQNYSNIAIKYNNYLLKAKIKAEID